MTQDPADVQARTEETMRKVEHLALEHWHLKIFVLATEISITETNVLKMLSNNLDIPKNKI